MHVEPNTPPILTSGNYFHFEIESRIHPYVPKNLFHPPNVELAPVFL
jgi:hypothetical protein